MGTEISEIGRQGQRVKQAENRDEQRTVGDGTEMEQR